MDLSKARMYVEVALLAEGEQAPADVSSLQAQAAAVTSVMQFVANPGVPTTMPWGDCLDAPCDRRSARITLTAKFPGTSTEAVAVHVLVESLPSTVEEAPAVAPQRVEWRSSFSEVVHLVDQQPQLIEDPQHAFGVGSVIVTGYLLTRPKDLFGLMACKAEQMGVDEIRPVTER